jgi:hypothetical protein
MDDNYQVPKGIKHIPLCPPRPGTPGESIYLDLWREWAEANPREWRAIFETRGPVRQRAASVAASFMVFMGCNAGRDFTREAEKMADRDRWRERSFLCAWAAENRRNSGVNSGLRTVEYMLASQHPIDYGHPIGPRLDWRRVPVVTMEDMDIVESMVVWWASSTASTIRAIAEPMIQAAEKKLLSGIFSNSENRVVAHG